jgi:hypothetical protein
MKLGSGESASYPYQTMPYHVLLAPVCVLGLEGNPAPTSLRGL